jgi:hypothetical protein
MTTATILTLLVVPIFYTFFDDARVAFMRALRRAFSQKPVEATSAAAVDTGRVSQPN